MINIIELKKVVRSPGFRKYFSNTSWIMGEKLGTMGVSFIVGAFVARHLQPEGIGLISYSQSIVIFFSILASVGIDTLLVRDLVQSPERTNNLMGTAFCIRLCGALISILALTSLLLLTESDSQTFTVALIIGMGILFQSFNVVDSFFQNKVLSRYVVRTRLVQFAFSTCLKVLLIWTNAPVLWFAIQLFLNDVVLGLGLAVAYTRHQGRLFDWKFDRRYALVILKDAWPIMLGGFMIIIYMKIDQIMIKHLIGVEATGIYAIAVKLSEIFYFIPGIICSSLFPAIINARKADLNRYYRRMQSLTDLMFVLAVGICLIVSLTGNTIIPFIYGEAYQEAGRVLTIHIWASIFVFLGVASSQWVLAENLQRYSLYNTMAGAVVNILLNLLLIPRMGIIGAAFATLISQAISAWLMYAIFPQTRPIFIIIVRSFSLQNIISIIRKKNRVNF